MILVQGFEVDAQTLGPARFVCRDAQYTDLSDMLRVTCKSGNNKSGMGARSGPLFNDVNLVALEFLTSFNDLYARIFLQISEPNLVTAFMRSLVDSPEGDGVGEHKSLMCGRFGLVRILFRRGLLRVVVRLFFFLCNEFDILFMRTGRPLGGRSRSAHERLVGAAEKVSCSWHLDARENDCRVGWKE